jgi:hypothetical protein
MSRATRIFFKTELESAYDQLYMYIQGSPVEIQTLTHCNVIDSSVNAAPHVVAQQYSSVTFSLCAFVPVRKTFFLGALKKCKSGNVYVYCKLNDNTTAGVYMDREVECRNVWWKGSATSRWRSRLRGRTCFRSPTTAVTMFP